MRSGAQLPSLTSLRAFAALLVVGYHLRMELPQSAGVFNAACFGFVGVSFFFVLSGFVLAWTARTDDTPGQFYLRRFARVYPMHVLTLVAVIALIPWLGPVVWTSLPANLFLVQTWTPTSNVFYSFNSVSWTLSCEAFFYVTFPLLYALLQRVRRPLLAAALIMTSMAAVMWVFNALSNEAPQFVAGLPVYRLGEFAVGILLAVAVKRGNMSAQPLRMPTPTVAVGLFVVVYAIAAHYRSQLWESANSWFVELLLLPFLALIIIACAHRDVTSSRPAFLHNRTPLKLGAWSFALYMVHLPVLQLLAKYVEHPTAWAAVGVAAMAVLAAVAVAAAAYEFFERPVERWIRSRAHARHTTTTPAPVPDREPTRAPERV